MSTAAKLINDVRSMMAGVRIGTVPDSANPARLEAGPQGHQLISDAAGWKLAQRDELLPALYGLPIAPVDDLQYGYRVLNGAGTVILEGMLTP